MIQARSLRLLANVYIEWNGRLHWQKAVNALCLAHNVCHTYMLIYFCL